jgi:hypothetical protein
MLSVLRHEFLEKIAILSSTGFVLGKQNYRVGMLFYCPLCCMVDAVHGSMGRWLQTWGEVGDEAND